MGLKTKLATIGTAGLGVIASAPGVLATELNTTAIESSFSLIYLFIPIMIVIMLLGWFFGMFDNLGKRMR